ncbi:hypothetical protein [Pedobacter nyackensis]|uniref:hypothetical protein n=1 Tax=Pedobacter nyackensis TaxID=475255 RepID=UPI00292F0F28|nr:hypothetical protein [Pedobacter nyackensis]
MSEESESVSREIAKVEIEVPRKKHDSLLKAAFQDCFAHLLRFFFKDADDIFDMGRGVDFVDKELLEITPDRLLHGGTKTTDMLARVYRFDGEEQWILLHLEIQGESNERFSYRMFEYYYRAIDRFNKPVVAFAVFTGSADQRHPSAYNYSLLGTEIVYRYNSYQIFQHSDKGLLDWDNPFALVVLAAKKAHLEKKISEEALNKERSIIARRLIASGKYTKKQIEDFVLFLKNILFVKSDEINNKFDREIIKLTGGQINMPGIRETVALIYREEAIEEGLREGIQRGLIQGLEKGLEQGIEQGIEKGLEQGLVQGRHVEALDIAREMKKDKFTIEKIAKLTKLSITEIRAL